MLSPKYVDIKSLREQINLLNPFLGEAKIKAFGVNKGDLVEAFLDAVNSIPAGQEKDMGIPDSVTLFYNSIVEGIDPVVEPKAPKAPRVPKAPGAVKSVRENANEAVAEKLIREGATEADFAEAFKRIYAERGVFDEAFVTKRTAIYYQIGMKRASMGPIITQDPNLPNYEPGTPVPGEAEITGQDDPTAESTE
jgi:hypothetical protein